MSYFTNDVDTVADALNNSFAMTIQSFIQLAGTLVLLFILNWQLSLIVVVGYAAMFLYIRFSAKRSTSYYTTQQAALGDVNGYIEEMVSGQKVVKVFNHEPANLRVFQAKNEALRQAGTGAQSYAATMVPAVVSISYINYAIVAVVGGLMALRGMTDIGSLSSYLVFVRQAAMPINQFTQQSNFLLAAMAGAERIFEAMRLPPEVDEGRIRLVNTRGEGVTLTACAEKTGRWAWQKPDGSLVPLRGDVRFHDVTFGYEKGRPILQNISLYAKPGQKIAFVGSTGAGKTTITNLINRFYDIDAGSVTYDGIDVRDIAKDSLRQSLGIVLQDTHLFTGTIADNIRFGKLDATREEIVRAARIANADSFIRRLPQGYDTRITSDGASLSQGQRQLLAIARAAVADPPVLILDEATSSIDTRTGWRAAPSLSSPTGCPPSATPTPSSCWSTARWWSGATTTPCWPRRANTTSCTTGCSSCHSCALGGTHFCAQSRGRNSFPLISPWGQNLPPNRALGLTASHTLSGKFPCMCPVHPHMSAERDFSDSPAGSFPHQNRPPSLPLQAGRRAGFHLTSVKVSWGPGWYSRRPIISSRQITGAWQVSWKYPFSRTSVI